jgi:hypothetical protein
LHVDGSLLGQDGLGAPAGEWGEAVDILLAGLIKSHVTALLTWPG